MLIGSKHHVFQTLESRLLLTTYTVSNTADSGGGSLRQAILDANGHAGADTIAFSIGTGPQSIAPTSALPEVTGAVTFDATTQPGYSGNPIIQISGSSAGGFSTDGLIFSGGNNTVRGIIVNRWSGSGIVVKTNGTNVFENNWIGTDLTGLAAAGNRVHGLYITANSARVGGPSASQRNVICSNGGLGLFFQFSNSNTVQGNYIGVGKDGLTALGNATGVDIDSGGGTVFGGSGPGEGNVISGNVHDGLLIYSSSSNNLVQGNLIGTDYTGTQAVANNDWGIELQGANNLIGGTTASARNILSGNVASGIVLYLGASQNNHVIGNYIGTDITGTKAIPNVNQGVSFSGDTDVDLSAAGPANNFIGGTTPAERNLISGNGTGVGIFNRTRNNTISGNWLGVDVTGTKVIPNATGINIFNSSDHNTIGGTAPGSGNVIAASTIDGINIGSDYTSVQGNTFGLAPDGVTPMPSGGHGILTIFSSHNVIGGATAAARNVIANSNQSGVKLAGGVDNQIVGNWIGVDTTGVTAGPISEAGVWFDGSGTGLVSGNIIAHATLAGVYVQSGTGNKITANSISQNAGLGIDLNNDGVTVNDAAPDSDTGANNLQNFPVLTSATQSGGLVNIAGSLASAGSSTFTIEFFATPAADSTGYGEGQTYLGSTTVNTDSSGNATFATQLSAGTQPGQAITATATAADGSTSEFSHFIALDGLAVLSSAIDTSSFPFKARFTFSQDAGASLDLSDLVIRNAAGGADIAPTAVNWDSGTKTALFTFPTSLADGNYRAVLLRAGVHNANNQTPPADVSVDFYILPGDADRSRDVGLNDLLRLANHYGLSGVGWADGDFDGDGIVGLNDLLLLANHYGLHLDPPAAAPAVPMAAPVAPVEVAITAPAANPPATSAAPAINPPPVVRVNNNKPSSAPNRPPSVIARAPKLKPVAARWSISGSTTAVAKTATETSVGAKASTFAVAPIFPGIYPAKKQPAKPNTLWQ